MRIALYQPDIPGNVGAVLRTAACFGVGVDLIEPLGFIFSDARLRRAGMDYAEQVPIVRHADWNAFKASTTARILLMSAHGDCALTAVTFAADDVLLIGSESSGVPPEVRSDAAMAVRIPIARSMRSLNMSVAAGIAVAEALRQTGGLPS